MHSLRSPLSIALSLIILLALMPVPCVSLLRSVIAQRSAERTPRPRPGKPEGTLPDLDEVQRESRLEREPPAPVHSTVRSAKIPQQPWNGRRVGDPPEGKLDHPDERRAHARRRISHALAVLDDQFVQSFFTAAVLRSPNNDEATFWSDQLRVAYAQGQTSVKLAAVALGKTLFESAEYAARNRDNHWYVYDLYKTFLMRDPDASGWAYWESVVPPNGRENVRRAFEEAPEFAGIVAGIVPNGSATADAASLISARVEPRNQPGHGMLARDATWSVPLLSLPGRNGLDLGLALSYSSQVWTRSGPYIHFDEDNGFPSPGFRLGFPVIQRKVFDAQTAKTSFLLITAGGQRVQLRQVGTSNIYEAADSSYLQLTDNSPSLVLRSTDGTQLSFLEVNNEFVCWQVKDRNGNYLTNAFNSLGRTSSITDTLGRVITFNYDSNANLISITQSWNGQPSHQWVSFGWGTMQSSFSEGGVVGIADGAIVPVITQVSLNDTSYFTFDYNNSLQVTAIKNYFGAVERNATTFTYETLGSDVPRLLESRVSAQNWTGVNGVPSQVITRYSVALDGACVLTAPDGTIYKEYYGTGWQKGLTTQSEVWSGGVRQKWTTTAWTQDNVSVGYEMNPRVVEINVYDASSNRRRTLIDYGQYGLPSSVKEFEADGVTVIRQTLTEYNLSPPYLDRRIIGLVSQVKLKNASSYESKITYEYDDPARLQSLPAAAVQHDSTSVSARGNITAVSRWDVNDISNASKKLTTYTNYYATGVPSSSTDPAGHQSSVSYTDSYSDSVNRNTFAYPTTMTDADGFSSYVQYNFDIGATTRTQSPAPAGQTQGAIQTMSYNSLGQLELMTTANNGAYKRFWYGSNYAASLATVNNVADELYSISVTDGLGRVFGTFGNHPGSTGGYSMVITIYDQMGRAIKVSNPTEIYGNWAPSGDDAAGIYYTQQTYDWKGRPRITTNQDGTIRSTFYSGCGCAGDEVVTLTDEVGRQQKIYSDVLGRTWKTEILQSDGSIYSAQTTQYTARDQVTKVNSYKGLAMADLSCPSGTCMRSVSTYDGYGRLATHKLPQQTTATSYVYNADDMVQSVTDPRGVIATNTFNNRHLITGVSYTPVSGVAALSAVSFAYDAAGNRTSMSDGTGTANYHYDQLSRMTSETRTLSGLSNTYTINYGYNLAGLLTSLTDPSGAQVSYVYDSTGRLSSMPASGYNGVTNFLSNMKYRATGAMKQITYGNGPRLDLSYNPRLQIGQYQVTGLYAWSGGPAVTMGATMSYYNDGRTNTAFDLNDSRFDRKYEFDFSARLKEAYSGVEAHGAPPPPLAQADSPYRQTYSYDEWNNATLRTGRIWSAQNEYDAASYGSDNKRGGTNYDAAGNATWTNNEGWRTYDAAGRPVSFTSAQNWQIYSNWPSGHPDAPALETQETFDATGQVVKHVHHTRQDNTYDIGNGNLVYYMSDTTITTYSLHSTVLGGQTITHLDQNGNKMNGYVYAGGERMATQTISGSSNSVLIETTNPVTGATVLMDANGNNAIRQEPDPLGRDLSVAPGPTVVVDPIGNSKWNEPMPVEYAPYWTGELETGMAAYVNTMDMVMARESYKRWLKSELTSNRDRKIWEEILNRNPNVGIVKGEETLWGRDAADFLKENSAFITLGENGIIFRRQKSSKEAINPRKVAHRLLSNTEMKYLRYFFYRITENERCAKFLEGFLNKAAELNPGYRLVSDDIRSMFESIANGGGFWSAPGASYSTIGGDITNNTGTIYFYNDPQFRSYGRVNRKAERAFLGLTFYQMAQTAIHEILHHAGLGDRALATTAAFLNGEKVSFANSWEGSLAASEYWDKTFTAHCH